MASSYYWDDGIKYSSGYRILLDPQSITAHYEKGLTSGHTVVENLKLSNYLTSDYNKDGRDDVFIVKTSIVTHPSGNKIRYLNRSIMIYTTNAGSLESDLPIGNNSNSLSIHQSGNFLIPGDFDGDGNQDIITILGSTGPAGNVTYSGTFSSPSKFIFYKKIWNFTVTAPDYSALSIAEAKHLMPIDFDGDGKQEVWVTYGALSYILSIEPSQINNGDYNATILVSSLHIPWNDKLFPGDFNGDRKTDMLIKESSGSWKIHFSTGKALVETSFNFIQTVMLNGNYDDDKIVLADFNGDGKTNILHGYRVWVNGVSTSSKFSVYYSKAFSGLSAVFRNELYDYGATLPFEGGVSTGDFNGDGRNDLLFKGFYPSSSGDIIDFKANGKERLLVKVTDGHNVTSSFEYKNLTDKSTFPFVYNRTVDLDNPANGSPFNYVQLPLPVVASIIVPDGIGGVKNTSFFYENAVIHRFAKGFLGFKKVSTISVTDGINTVAENEINTQFAAPYNVKQT